MMNIQDLSLERGKGNPFKSSHKTSVNRSNQISQLQASNLEHKKTIASLKRAQGQSQPAADDDDIEDAGNSFGGKAKKAKDKK